MAIKPVKHPSQKSQIRAVQTSDVCYWCTSKNLNVDDITPRLICHLCMANFHKLLNSPHWRALRLSILTAQPTCVRCDNYRTPASIIDHILPWSNFPQKFWDRSNLQPLCIPCHAEKTKEDMSKYRHNQFNG